MKKLWRLSVRKILGSLKNKNKWKENKRVKKM